MTQLQYICCLVDIKGSEASLLTSFASRVGFQYARLLDFLVDIQVDRTHQQQGLVAVARATRADHAAIDVSFYQCLPVSLS